MIFSIYFLKFIHFKEASQRAMPGKIEMMTAGKHKENIKDYNDVKDDIDLDEEKNSQKTGSKKTDKDIKEKEKDGKEKKKDGNKKGIKEKDKQADKPKETNEKANVPESSADTGTNQDSHARENNESSSAMKLRPMESTMKPASNDSAPAPQREQQIQKKKKCCCTTSSKRLGAWLRKMGGQRLEKKETRPVEGIKISIEDLMASAGNQQNYNLHSGGDQPQKARIQSWDFPKAVERKNEYEGGNLDDDCFVGPVAPKMTTEKDLIDLNYEDPHQRSGNSLFASQIDENQAVDAFMMSTSPNPSERKFQPIEEYIEQDLNARKRRDETANACKNEMMGACMGERGFNAKAGNSSGSDSWSSINSENDELYGTDRKTIAPQTWNGNDSIRFGNTQTYQFASTPTNNILIDSNLPVSGYYHKKPLLDGAQENRYAQQLGLSTQEVKGNAENRLLRKDRFGKMVKTRPVKKLERDSTYVAKRGASVLSDHDINKILELLDEPVIATTKKNPRKKSKKVKIAEEATFKQMDEAVDQELVEMARNSPTLLTRTDANEKTAEGTDSCIYETIEEAEANELKAALQASLAIQNEVSKKMQEVIKPRVSQQIGYASSAKQTAANTFITRTESFPSLSEAVIMKNDVSGKHQHSTPIKPKSEFLHKKSSKKGKDLHLATRDVLKHSLDESDQLKVLIVDEDPLTPIGDITQLHGITFFYDETLEQSNGDIGKQQGVEEPVDESGIGSSYNTPAKEQNETVEGISSSVTSSSEPIIQAPAVKSLFSNLSKKSNALYQRLTGAWNAFQHTGTKPIVYVCGKEL
ncbi:unnamed protein product, partial [Mesorhabditis belari]|uniref:Uncharacterized protein n=1 Tax=Mesorhabditis belari TaxID=2138241 RepID=A0AAF3J2J2_9BILA